MSSPMSCILRFPRWENYQQNYSAERQLMLLVWRISWLNFASRFHVIAALENENHRVKNNSRWQFWIKQIFLVHRYRQMGTFVKTLIRLFLVCHSHLWKTRTNLNKISNVKSVTHTKNKHFHIRAPFNVFFILLIWH